MVPSIWPLEAANATIMGGRRKRLNEARSRRFFVLVEALPIVVDDETSSRAFGEIVHLARIYPLSARNAAYLELGIRRGLPLACHDGKLKTAALAAGAALYIPLITIPAAEICGSKPGAPAARRARFSGEVPEHPPIVGAATGRGQAYTGRRAA